jgi:hypothetical protein
MLYSNIIAIASLTGRGTPQNAKSKVPVHLGHEHRTDFPQSNTIVAWRRLRMFGANEIANISFAPLEATQDNAYNPPTAQVETATAAGTITTSGNAEVTVTVPTDISSADIVLQVPVNSGDTASQWAGKVRAALAAHPLLRLHYRVSGNSTAIRLTRIVDDYGFVNDGLNIALDNGTCAGITPAATSANTTQGQVASGVIWDQTDAVDAEGLALPNLDDVLCLYIEGVRGNIRILDDPQEDVFAYMTGTGTVAILSCPRGQRVNMNYDLKFENLDDNASELYLGVVLHQNNTPSN